jgi:hypothetical protein
VNERQFEQAIRSYWTVREAQAAKQLASGRTDAGLRGQATGGAHLDAIAMLLEEVFINAGFPPSAIRRSTGIELPGYYRPTKKWDLVVVDQGRLVAAIELKSHVGPSFGNNVNNRIEEALGSAVDVWKAYENGLLGPTRPWLGYLLLLEETARSTSPVRLSTTVFPADPAFVGTSYKDRYRILCRRLVRERLYDAVCFVTSSKVPGEPVQQPDPEIGFDNFVASIVGWAAYLKAL